MCSGNADRKHPPFPTENFAGDARRSLFWQDNNKARTGNISTMITCIKPTCFTSNNLTLLSWNIAMARPSSMAPDAIERSREIGRLIRQECLGQPSNPRTIPPDVIALQECPYPSWGADNFDSLGYTSLGTRKSHCGHVDLLLRKELANGFQPIELNERLPSVACSFTLPNESHIAVSSSHLMPFKEGFPTRYRQCNLLMKSLVDECANCVLLGDFNMRAAEDKAIEQLCGGWIDAWKANGAEKLSNFTWNSFVNQYHEGGYKFKARFDRCYLKGDALNLQHFRLIGNNPVRKEDNGGVGDYLSDHFGLLVRINVEAPTSTVQSGDD
ncbi:hypothetical protein ACHAW6_012844 [Cyclotella cf. meneghiniana]